MRTLVIALALIALAAPLRAQESELEKITGETCNVSETDHFRVDTHQDTAWNASLASKCEQGYAWFYTALGLPADTPVWKDKCRVYGCDSKAAWGKYIDSLGGSDRDKDLKKMLAHTRRRGSRPHASACFENSQSIDAFEMALIHNVGHDLLCAWHKNEKPPIWIDEGFASLFEMKVLERTGSYCIGGGTAANDPNKNWKQGSEWPGLLKEAAKAHKDADFAVMRKKKEWSSITHEERAKAYSLVAYMVETDAKKFVEFVNGLKDGKQDDTALGDAWGGLTFEKLEKDWREWVLKNG